MILAIVNNKGGVGKTTTAVNLAAALAGKNRRVLLVDLDSQGSASLSLGIPRAELSPSSAEVLLEGESLSEAIRKTEVEGLDLLTGSIALANADLRLSETRGRESLLKGVMEPIRGDYGFIVVDCPPSLSLLPINALVSCDYYMVPVVPHYLALEGLVNLTDAVERVRQGIGTGASLLGFLLTMVDYRLRVTHEIVKMIRDHYKGKVFKAEVRVNVRLTEAPSFGQTIFDYDGSSTGSQAYRRLATEVLQRVKKGGPNE